MANYSLVINSRFRPFTFQELVAPWQMYGQAYKEQEESLNNLEMQANTIEAMINRARDVKAAERYDEYMKGLTAQAEALTTRGLSPAVRSAVNSLRGDYFSKIVPIQKAYETMTKQIEEQRKYGDSRINEYNASELSIDDFLDNPEKSFRTIDRNALYTRSAAAYSAFQNELSDYYLQKDPKIKDNFQKAFIQKYGMRPEEATKFIDDVRTQMNNGVPFDQIVGTNPALMRVFNDLYQGSGVGTWGSRNAEIEAANTILSGAMNSVGKSSINLVTNQAAVLEAQYKKAPDVANAKNKGSSYSDRKYTPRNFYTIKEREEAVNDWRKFRDLFSQDSNGDWHIKPVRFSMQTGTLGGTGNITSGKTAEGVFLSKYGLNKPLNNDIQNKTKGTYLEKFGNKVSKSFLTQEELNNTVNKYMNLIDNNYDALGHTEYVRKIAEENYADVLSTLKSVAVNGKIVGSDYFNKDKNGVPTFEKGKEFDISGLEKKDIDGSYFVESPLNNTIYLEVAYSKEGGDSGTIRIPVSDYNPDLARKASEFGALSQLAKNQVLENPELEQDEINYGNMWGDVLIGNLAGTKAEPAKVESNTNAAIQMMLQGLGY